MYISGFNSFAGELSALTWKALLVVSEVICDKIYIMHWKQINLTNLSLTREWS